MLQLPLFLIFRGKGAGEHCAPAPSVHGISGRWGVGEYCAPAPSIPSIPEGVGWGFLIFQWIGGWGTLCFSSLCFLVFQGGGGVGTLCLGFLCS